MSISKKSQQIVDEFDEACQNYGYQIDQGYGVSVNNAIDNYNKNKEKMIKLISRLENKIKRFEAKHHSNCL